MYIKPQDASLNDLLKTASNGIYITDVQGLHCGLNAISGDFSLSANGFLIEEGQLTRPVHVMRNADFYIQEEEAEDLLKEIEQIGNDLAFGPSTIGSPTLLIHSLAVAGE